MDDVSRLVGIDGLVVTGVVELREQLELEVELIDGAGCCRWCGRGSLMVKDRPVVRIRDLPVAGRVTWLLWRKRRYWCEACERTFTETHPGLPSRQRVSARFRAHLFERARGGGAHLEIARDERTTCYQVNRAFAVAGDRLLAGRQRQPVRRVSFDEAHHRRGRELATVVSDLDRRRVIEVLPGCQRKLIERWFADLPDQIRAGIEVVSIDPSNNYRDAIRAALPDVRIVCDRFHLVRGAGRALDSVRHERQRRGGDARRKGVRRRAQEPRRHPELYRQRRRLLKARERLTGRERQRLAELFATDPVIAEAWGLKEAFRDIYKANSRAQAEQQLDKFLAATGRAELPAFTAFAHGIHSWREELLAYFDEPTTNGYAEGVINKVKVIKRRGYGIPTFHSYRKRIVIACG
ncbi:MAG TPA: ISL3 family transposase [Solirubrobacteraceae bacterium]|nr:ISL3 family transposase [Solirubrobacteraceae bacterium]